MGIMTDNELYQAALTLGKHLEFSSFLNESRLLMQQHSPLEKVIMAGFSPGNGVMTIISMADREGPHDIGGKLSVPAEVGKTLSGMGAPVSMLTRASASVPAKLLIERGLLAGDASLIMMRIIMGKNTIGLLFCTAEPGKEFSRAHGALFAELRPIFALGIGNCLQHRTVLSRHQRLKEDVNYFTTLQCDRMSSEVIGAGMGLRGVMQEVRRLAPVDDHICVSGEQGCGRNFIAREIHTLSARQDKAFVEINCNRIPEKQLEEQLFGEDHAFTGSHSGYKKGLLLRGSGGTVYLQGIEAMSEKVRARLEKVITSKEIIHKERKERIKCDVRFITLIDSEDDRQSPLYKTLASTVIRIPSLRDRKEDILRLAVYFSEQACRKLNRLPVLELDKESLECCLNYDWPGNVRELENIIERGVLLAVDDKIRLTDLLPGDAVMSGKGEGAEADLNLDNMIARHIIRAMQQTQGKVGGADGAAHLMGINPSTLRKRMRKLKIPFGRKTHYGK